MGTAGVGSASLKKIIDTVPAQTGYSTFIVPVIPTGTLLKACPLAIFGGGRSLRPCFNSGGVEDVSFYFPNISLSGKFFAVEEETDSCGISDLYNDVAGSANRGMRGRDKGFVADVFAVGGNRNPGGLLGADPKSKSGWRRSRESAIGTFSDQRTSGG
jgi:hypothetical protein